MQSIRPPSNKITLIYVICGIIWIISSHYLITTVGMDESLIQIFELVKGLAYVVLTAVLLNSLIQSHFKKLIQSQQELQVVNRTHSMLNASYRMMLETDNQEILLKRLCEIIIKNGEYKFVWFGFVQDDPENKIIITAYSGNKDIKEGIKLEWIDSELRNSPTRMAIRNMKTVIVNNLDKEPNNQPWNIDALNQGLFSNIAIPLEIKEKIYGILNIYTSNYSKFDVEEVKLLEQLVEGLSQSLKSFWLGKKVIRLENTVLDINEFYNFLFNKIMNPIVVNKIDAQGNLSNIFRVNDAACVKYGYTQAEFQFKTVKDLTPSYNWEKIPLSLNEILKGNELIFENDQIDKDQHIFPAEISSNLIYLQGQAMIISLIQDITQRKNFEKESIRTQKLEAITLITSSAAHDLNNFLCAIKGWAELANDQMENKLELEKCLKEMNLAINRSTILVRKFVSFSRKEILLKSYFKVNDALIQFNDEILNRLIKSQVSIQFNLNPDIRYIYADINQFEQIILNLVINAQDAILDLHNIKQKKEVIISTSFKIVDHVSYIAMEIQDSGIGMDEITLKRLFEPFFTTKPPGKGTGLGLYTIKKILDRYNCKVQIESELGIGTTIRILWPSIEHQEFEGDSAHLAVQNNKLKGTGKILFIDDDTNLLMLMSESLKLWGYEIIVTDEMNKAKEIIKNEINLNLIVIDFTMLDIDGPAFLKKLKTQDKIPFFFITGYYHEYEEKIKPEFGDILILKKPFSIFTLLREIKKILKD